MTSSIYAVGSFACIAIAGSDARRFAQAQFSGDVDALAPGHWQWNAWLAANGRVRALLHLVDTGNDRLLAVLRGGNAEGIHAALTRYVLRMHVNLDVRRLSGHAGGPVPASTSDMEADGTLVLGYGARSLRLTEASTAPDPVARTVWQLEDIRQGWPWLPPDESEFLPPALGLEHLGAISFAKGCYPGQEIAARLHHRGGHKYRLHHMHGSQALPVGAVRDPAGGVAAWVLAAAQLQEGVEALIVAPQSIDNEITYLGMNYSVISTFDA